MPDWKNELATRLASLRLAPPRETEIIEELSQHLDDPYEHALLDGLTPKEAKAVALCDATLKKARNFNGNIECGIRSLRSPYCTTGLPSVNSSVCADRVTGSSLIIPARRVALT